jgi:bifunctional non-homologous end joining protein LigD
VGRPAQTRTPGQLQQFQSLPTRNAAFLEPMDCLAVATLPEGPQWLWEIKLGGHRAIAARSEKGVTLYFRSGKSLNGKFPYVVEPLRGLSEGTCTDGELVALDDLGRPEQGPTPSLCKTPKTARCQRPEVQLARSNWSLVIRRGRGDSSSAMGSR